MPATLAIEPAIAGAAAKETRRPVEIALDAALLIVQNGGSTSAADGCFDNVLSGYGQTGVTAIWRLDVVAAVGHGSDASLYMRPVGPIGVNLVRVSDAVVLGQRVARGEILSSQLETEVDRIQRLPSPYGRWLIVLVAAATAACFSRIPGGDWGSFGIAFVAAGAGQLLRSALQSRQIGVAHLTAVCGLLSATIAAIGLRLGYSDAKPATMIASIIYLVPGLPLINGFLDMMSHKYLLVGIERMFNALFLFLVLAIAIAFAHHVVL